jgi:hypothetical protein
MTGHPAGDCVGTRSNCVSTPCYCRVCVCKCLRNTFRAYNNGFNVAVSLTLFTFREAHAQQHYLLRSTLRPCLTVFVLCVRVRVDAAGACVSLVLTLYAEVGRAKHHWDTHASSRGLESIAQRTRRRQSGNSLHVRHEMYETASRVFTLLPVAHVSGETTKRGSE